MADEEPGVTLLGDIQARAVDDGASVASLLRRCLLLANRLSYPPLGEWAAQELEGYPADVELPSYRLARSGAYGNFLGLGHMQRRGVTIPAGALPAAHRRFAESLFLRDGVAAYESILPQARAGELRVPWPGDLTLSHQNSLLEGWILTDAFQVVPPGVIPGLLDALRTKVLKFAMELERLSPSAGESPPDATPIPEAALATVFNTVIIGDQANVAIGSPSSSLSQGVTPGDLLSLLAALRELGVPEADLEELATAIQSEQAEPGQAVHGWLGRLASKAAAGAVELGTSVVGSAVWSMIQAYYRLGSS
jgi:hypothetical protein